MSSFSWAQQHWHTRTSPGAKFIHISIYIHCELLRCCDGDNECQQIVTGDDVLAGQVYLICHMTLQTVCVDWRWSLMQTIRATTEWRRWEEANKWAWDRDRRSRWAESIWQRQQSRKLRLAEYARNKAKADAKYKSEQENEARRRARYGTSSSRHYPQFSGQNLALAAWL